MDDSTQPSARDDRAEHADRIATAAYESIRSLNHATLDDPPFTPAEVYRVLGSLVELTAALPQTLNQLGSILDRAHHDQILMLDAASDDTDPGVAIGAARLDLDLARRSAVDLAKALDHAQHNLVSVTSYGAP